MESEKFIPFMINYSAALLFCDLYFNIAWRNFIRKNNYNSLIYKIPILISFLMVIVVAYTIWIQIGNIVPGAFGKKLFALKSIWYLPKSPIVIVLILRDLIRLINRVINKQVNFKFITRPFRILSKRLYEQEEFSTISKLQLAGNVNYNVNYEIDHEEAVENKLIETNKKPETNNDRRKFLKNSTWAMAGIPFFIITKGVVKTTYDFKIFKETLYLRNLPTEFDGITLAQISDIHAGSFITSQPVQEVVRMTNELHPDLTFVTGDFVNFNPSEYDLVAGPLSQLRSEFGTYGCLGNHDHYMSESNLNILKQKIENSGIQLLNNKNFNININNNFLNIAGSDNTGYHQNYADFEKSLSGIENDYSTILLSHDPTNWNRFIKNKKNVDLMLSGHTHGGQVGIEYNGDILSPARVAYKEFAGLYQHEDQYLYINRGIGTTGPPVRVGVNPEITFITLKKNIIS